jgi:hypothetical protein
MKYRHPSIAAIATLLFVVSPLKAQHGGFGGHASGGFSGHSIGHSFGHAFGHHSGGRGKGTSLGRGKSEVPPLAGAAMIHGKVVQLPNPQKVMAPGRRRFHREPFTEFAPGRRFGFGRNSDFGFCGSFSGFPTRHFFGGDFDCFRGGFFFDPFFLGGFFPGAFGIEEFGGPVGASDDVSEGNPAMSAEGGYEDSAQANSQTFSQKSATPSPGTLLQLTDGSMYGLTDYWLVGDRLHYVTNYGGENSIPLERIDFEKTIQLNADQGTKFELRSKPAVIGR